MGLVHRGKIIKNAIAKSGFKVGAVADQAGVVRQSMYYMFRNPKLSYKRIREIGRILNYDFSRDIPEMNRLKVVPREKDPARELQILQAKYLILQEQYTKLLLEKISLAKPSQTRQYATRRKR